MWYYQNTKWLPSAENVGTGESCPPLMYWGYTYLAREILWSRRQFTQGEAQPLHCGCADPCEFPKCGNLDCIIYGSGGLRSRSPLMSCLMINCCLRKTDWAYEDLSSQLWKRCCGPIERWKHLSVAKQCWHLVETSCCEMQPHCASNMKLSIHALLLLSTEQCT
jgi:hypothetical protein